MIEANQLLRLIKIFRLPNLIIIVLIECLLHNQILLNIFARSNIIPEMDAVQLGILILFTIVLTTGGYIINDIYDVETDKLNKPGQNWVELLGTRKTKIIYFLTVIISVGFSLFLAIQLNKLSYFWITPLMILMLWAYSRYFKSLSIYGNLFVSVFCALIVLLVFLSETRAIKLLNNYEYKTLYYQSFLIFGLYGLFAFVTTFIRELVKDIQDIEGDKKTGAKTLPIKYGIPITTMLLYLALLILLSLFSLVFIAFGEEFSYLQIGFITAFIVIPVLIIFYLVIKSKEPSEFGFISNILKFVMLTGTLFLLTLPL